MPLIALLAASVTAVTLSLWPSAPSAGAAPPVRAVQVIRAYPHDPSAFCQGLVIHNGQLLEGTGQYQKSRLRIVELETGRPLIDVKLDADVFGEGITVWKDQVYQLTWKNGYLLIYDVADLKRRGYVRYRDIDPSLKEGWGITHDGTHLIISDGSSVLRFVDPDTFQLIRKLHVKNGFRGPGQLNELEYVEGQVFANVWYKDQIARIDPDSGQVVGWLDVSAIKPREVRFNREAVLNGIAWDAESRRLFVTGKNWPTLFEIALPEVNPR